ncbi:hypothetical protein AGLY_017482 [Aphis glycines]|uniref:Reverse transcriptase domain-containing protein n=1 Tax=Aphis glycines TaxID=307491 RepID=A0A6G0SVF6_APHGL|nr:hypothetical protein AGLY_017482 [Aphis glycines]
MLGFADDTLLVVASKAIPDLERLANRALEQIAKKISDLSLQIAAEKTEAVLFTGGKNIVCGTPIKITDQMTYLGVVIDRWCLFKTHIQIATQKAPAGRRATGETYAKRRWARRDYTVTLDVCRQLSVVAWGAVRKVLLRKVSAYRTVSEAAACVIAATPPADLLAKSREVSYLKRKRGTDRPGYPTKEEWQRRWDSTETGQWTKRLIPNVAVWMERSFGEVNYHLSQFLSGHGCFGKYLCKIKKVENTSCVDRGSPMDDAEHAFFACVR